MSDTLPPERIDVVYTSKSIWITDADGKTIRLDRSPVLRDVEELFIKLTRVLTDTVE